MFFARVPLPEHARSEIQLSDSWDYAVLAEGVEAWGFRASQERQEPLDRHETALLWLETEYRPVVAMLREAQLVGELTEAEAYMSVAAARYRLMRAHRWDDEVMQRVDRGRQAPPPINLSSAGRHAARRRCGLGAGVRRDRCTRRRGGDQRAAEQDDLAVADLPHLGAAVAAVLGG